MDAIVIVFLMGIVGWYLLHLFSVKYDSTRAKESDLNDPAFHIGVYSTWFLVIAYVLVALWDVYVCTEKLFL